MEGELASDLLRFDKDKGKLYLKGAKGEQQIVAPSQATNKTVFVLVDASGSMAIKKFDDAAKGALDFGLVCINKRYQVGVVVFSDKASASSPTSDPIAFRAKIGKLRCTSGGTHLASALSHTFEFKPAYVLVVTDGEVADCQESLAAADRLKSSGTEILTIGTDDANQEFLRKLASRSDLSVKVASAELSRAISDTSRLLR
jgi:Mg-chelatase subunit ChlD